VGVGVGGVLKVEYSESESEVLCTDCTALIACNVSWAVITTLTRTVCGSVAVYYRTQLIPAGTPDILTVLIIYLSLCKKNPK
jgi:hypothetical protein